jgi:hypothetical protein
VKIEILEIGFNLAQMPFKSLPRVHPVIEIVDFMFFMPASQAAPGAWLERCRFENTKIRILNTRFSLAQFRFEGLSTVLPVT